MYAGSPMFKTEALSMADVAVICVADEILTEADVLEVVNVTVLPYSGLPDWIT